MLQNTTFVCPACDVATSSTSKLYCHLERHLGQRPFSCRLCDKKYVLKFEANRHIKEKHPNEEIDANRLEDANYDENPIVAIECLRCRGLIRSRDDLKHHALRHSGFSDDEETKRGLEKEERSRRKLYAKEEMNLRKLMSARWKCLVCSELQPDLTEMSFHMNEHVNCLRYECVKCGMTFNTRTKALAHTLIEEGASFRVDTSPAPPSDSFPFPCKRCSETVTSLEVLQAHIHLHYVLPE